MSDRESFDEWWRRKNWEFKSSADEMEVMIGCEQAFVAGKRLQQSKYEKLLVERDVEYDALEREYSFFADQFDSFFEFMEDRCNGAEFEGNTYQENAILIIKELESQLAEQNEELKKAYEKTQEVVDICGGLDEKLALALEILKSIRDNTTHHGHHFNIVNKTAREAIAKIEGRNERH